MKFILRAIDVQLVMNVCKTQEREEEEKIGNPYFPYS
jgi:hypothetical protein